ARDDAQGPPALRSQERVLPAASSRRPAHWRHLRDLARVSYDDDRRARAARCHRRHRRRADPRPAALSRARRRVPLDGRHTHRDDRGARSVPRGPPAPRRRGCRRARRATRRRRGGATRLALRVIVDYHAMLVDGPYRVALRPEPALGELRRLSGTWYDPQIVDEFATMFEARGTIQAVEEEVGATSRELAILAELTPEFHTL